MNNANINCNHSETLEAALPAPRICCEAMHQGQSSRMADEQSESHLIFTKTIEDLDDYFLYTLFEGFSVKEKLSVERVCKRWQRIILHLISKQCGLGTTWNDDKESNCLDYKSDHCVYLGDIRSAIPMTNGWFYNFTQLKALQNLRYISQKCPNIKCLHLNHGIINNQSLRAIIEIFPFVKCIHLKGNILEQTLYNNDSRIVCQEWNDIGETLNHHIQHLSIDSHYEFKMNEMCLTSLIKNMKNIQEFRIGNNFDGTVRGEFVKSLSKECKVFQSLDRVLSYDAIKTLSENCDKQLTHLSFFFCKIRTTQGIKFIGEKFNNLVQLRINSSFDETILNTPSPLSQLRKLKELALDMRLFTDSYVDDGLIWCIKDGLTSLEELELTGASLSTRAYNAIEYCLPKLKKLVLHSSEIQCTCSPPEVRTRIERYNCGSCKIKSWESISGLCNLRNLHILASFERNKKPKPFDKELCELLPKFKSLRILEIMQHDISTVDIIKNLSQLMKETGPNDYFKLYLKAVPAINRIAKSKKVQIISDKFLTK